MTATIQFNAAATTMLQGRTGSKLRIFAQDGELRVRPTDRKAGPWVLSEYRQHGQKGIAVDIDEKQLEKLGAGDIMAHQAQFNVVKDKYGWFALRNGEESAERATISMKGGAKATKSDEGGDSGGDAA
ncbi:MAG TPA: hypothetical protein VF598_02195 [Hymenobacter sp.]